VEDILLAQDRFAAARDADDQVDCVAQESPVQDLVEALVAAR
jgi:hypothetical protein